MRKGADQTTLTARRGADQTDWEDSIVAVIVRQFHHEMIESNKAFFLVKNRNCLTINLVDVLRGFLWRPDQKQT